MHCDVKVCAPPLAVGAEGATLSILLASTLPRGSSA